jgi:hypothetical protein
MTRRRPGKTTPPTTSTLATSSKRTTAEHPILLFGTLSFRCCCGAITLLLQCETKPASRDENCTCSLSSPVRKSRLLIGPCWRAEGRSWSLRRQHRGNAQSLVAELKTGAGCRSKRHTPGQRDPLLVRQNHSRLRGSPRADRGKTGRHASQSAAGDAVASLLSVSSA